MARSPPPTPALPESARPRSTGDLGLTGGICHRCSLQAFKQSSFAGCLPSVYGTWRPPAPFRLLSNGNLNLLAFECSGLECCTSTDVGIQ
ncbi:hypothetical protein GJ744_006231 [Endocarpon pusillum]|uniref:Uncharacterized protein n=1 Tax=Endocarpon pusillum TaxID=364733 RepID=A0A8H7ANG5_9EURO|nr:hypothetical protein GJ744_006231 [Endocarpon pusillum]